MGLILASSQRANAKDFATFNCAAGDINYAVTMSQMLPPYVVVNVSVSEYMDRNLNRQFALNRTRPSADGTVAYIGTDMYDGAVKFIASSNGNVAIKIKNGQSYPCAQGASSSRPVAEPPTQQDLEAQRNHEREIARTSYMNADGYALGGRLYRLPGKDYERRGIVRKGEKLSFIGRTSQDTEGYSWYKVRTNGGRTGFMWGGDLCYAYKRLDGVYGSCRSQGVNIPNMWMVIAVDTVKGHGRPGIAIDREEARRIALRKCGRNCKIIDEGQPLCHAYSASRKAGYYDGTARGNSLSDVRRRARDNCEKHAAIKGTCKIKFASCQTY